MLKELREAEESKENKMLPETLEKMLETDNIRDLMPNKISDHSPIIAFDEDARAIFSWNMMSRARQFDEKEMISYGSAYNNGTKLAEDNQQYKARLQVLASLIGCFKEALEQHTKEIVFCLQEAPCTQAEIKKLGPEKVSGGQETFKQALEKELGVVKFTQTKPMSGTNCGQLMLYSGAATLLRTCLSSKEAQELVSPFNQEIDKKNKSKLDSKDVKLELLKSSDTPKIFEDIESYNRKIKEYNKTCEKKDKLSVLKAHADLEHGLMLYQIGTKVYVNMHIKRDRSTHATGLLNEFNKARLSVLLKKGYILAGDMNIDTTKPQFPEEKFMPYAVSQNNHFALSSFKPQLVEEVKICKAQVDAEDSNDNLTKNIKKLLGKSSLYNDFDLTAEEKEALAKEIATCMSRTDKKVDLVTLCSYFQKPVEENADAILGQGKRLSVLYNPKKQQEGPFIQSMTEEAATQKKLAKPTR